MALLKPLGLLSETTSEMESTSGNSNTPAPPPAETPAAPAAPKKSWVPAAKIWATRWGKRGGGVVCAVFVLGLAVKYGPETIGQSEGYRVTEDFFVDTFSEGLDFIGRPWENVQRKVDTLRRSEEENERLRLENAFLKTKVEALQFDCHEKAAARATHDTEDKLQPLTGTKLGRTLASISYQVPEHLLPHQLYALAMTYFKAQEWEKAVVLLNFLAHQDEQSIFKGPRENLLIGIAWYRLDNLDLAEQSFDAVLRRPTPVHAKAVEGGDGGDATAAAASEAPPEASAETAANAENTDLLMFQAQARLWKGLIAQRSGKHLKEQFWLRDLVDHHPHSREAAWVNPAASQGDEEAEAPKRSHRVPASD